MKHLLHLIDKNGNKITMTNEEFQQMKIESRKDLKNDLNWYLDNGYQLAKDVFKNIEDNNGSCYK